MTVFTSKHRLNDIRAVALILTLPLLFLRPDHLPVIVTRGGVDVRPSDIAIATVVGLCVFTATGVRLRSIRGWLWFAPLLALLLFSAITAPNAGTVVVAVLKLVEYFAFGIAITLLTIEQRAMRPIIVTLVACAGFAGVVGVIEVLHEHDVGARADWLMGADPLGLLGAAILIVAIAAPRTLGSTIARRAAFLSGLLCLLVAGSLSALVGLGLATGLAAVRRIGSFRRLGRASVAMFAAIVVCIGGAFVGMRWSDIRAATEQASGSHAQPRPGGSFSQRVMFADFGLRIWIDHPIFGVGFQQSSRLNNWAPYLASVRADFPALPAAYFPMMPGMSFGRPTNTTDFNLHNTYSQLLAETGVVGLVLFGLGFVGAARHSFRRLRTSELACTGALLVVVVLGALTRNELYGGLPETTVLVTGLAFAVAGGWCAPSARVRA
jgi:O-antigen ligase